MAVTIQGVDGITFNDASTQAKSASTGQTGSAPFYTARAWVNFNGTNGTIRSSGNISSVTRNARVDYTLTFTTAMPDANYAFTIGSNYAVGDSGAWLGNLGQNGSVAPTTTVLRLGNAAIPDFTYSCVVIFR
jgi:hypothetical protein